MDGPTSSGTPSSDDGSFPRMARVDTPPARPRPHAAGRRPPADEFAGYRQFAPAGDRVTAVESDGASTPPPAPPPPPAGTRPDPVVPHPDAFDAPPLSLAGVVPFAGRELPADYVKPYPEWRNAAGVLYAPATADVPPSLPPLALTFPVLLGDVVLPTTVRHAGARLRAAAAARAPASFDLGKRPSFTDDGAGWRPVDITAPNGPPSWMLMARASVIVDEKQGKKKKPSKLAPPHVDISFSRDPPEASAALALFMLQSLGAAELSARLVPSGPDGVAVAVTVSLTRAAFDVVGWGDSAAPDPAAAAVKPPVRTNRVAAALAVVLAACLSLGDGLRVGPDCDGALNVALPPAAAAAAAAPLLPHAQSLPVLLQAAVLPPDAPAAPPPAGLKTTLLPHQQSGLRWMTDREAGRDARGVGGLALHPLWVQLVAADGQTFYAFRGKPCRVSATFYTADWLAAPTAAGLVCDEMGTGKSLQMLSLVLAAPPPPGWAVEEDDDAGAATVDDGGPIPVKATLIVAPNNLLAQWAAEVDAHIHRGALTVGIYRGAKESARLAVHAERAARGAGAAAVAAAPITAAAARRKRSRSAAPVVASPPARRVTRVRVAPPPPSSLNGGIAAAAAAAGAAAAGGAPAHTVRPPRPWAESAEDGTPIPFSRCDVVFMSLEDLRAEAGWGAASPLQRVGVWRLVVDEAQLIASAASVAALAASAVYRRAAWMLSGTPVSRSVSEIDGLWDFLNLGPSLTSLSAVRALALSRPGTPARALASLFHVFALHRSRADAQLAVPPPAEINLAVQHARAEAAAYSAVLSRAHATLASSRRTALGVGPRRAKAAASLRLALVRLRQAACHPHAALAALGAGARVAPSAGVGEQRATMDVIMDTLVARAAAHDAAARRATETAALLAAGLRATGGERGAVSDLYACLARVGAETLALARDGDALDTVVRRRAADGGLAAPDDWPGAAAGGRALAAAICDLAASAGGAAGARGRGAAGARALRAITTAADTRAAVDAAADGEADAAAAAPRDRLDAAAAWAALYLDGLDVAAAVLEDDGGDATAIATAAAALRAALGVDDPAAAAAAAAPRFSRRARGMAVNEELGATAAARLAADHAAQRQALVLRVFDKLRARDGLGDRDRRRGGADEAVARAARARAAADGAWHSLKHALAQRAAFVRERNPVGGGGGDDGAFDADTACPVCFDPLNEPAVTPCGHAFCRACIEAALDAAAAARGGGGGACPVCRAPLAAADIVCAAPAGADAAAADAPAASEYGAKLGALVDMMATDTTCKAVVFSSWARLLKLAGAALAAAGVACVSLAGASPAARAAALASFRADPAVRVLLVIMSTAGGAAGLTLTEADTVVLLDACSNPGLEAQAASRVARLGQTRATRLVRVLARGTIDEPLAALAAERRSAGGGAAVEPDAAAAAADEDEGTVVRLLDAHP